MRKAKLTSSLTFAASGGTGMWWWRFSLRKLRRRMECIKMHKSTHIEDRHISSY